MSLQIQVTADVAGAGKQIDDFSKKSRIALNSLSLVAQDLPFGFIGIQNNLPGVISSFGELTREAGGVGGALKQLGGALIGPAGIFLAFSAVTSIVTSLTMKYGSLGAAFDAIFGKTTKLSLKIKELSDSYVQFNKNLKTSEDISSQEGASLNGTIAKIETLTKVILNQTKSYNERNAALNTLKELDKERFGNLDLETLKVKALTDAVNNYTNSLIAAAVTKGFEEEIGRTSVELSKQVSILKQLDEEKKKANAAPQRIVGKAELIDRTEIIKTESAYNKQLAVVKELTKRKEELSAEIRKSVEAQVALKAPVDAATAAIEKQKKALKEGIGKKVFGEQGEAIESAMSFDQVNKLLLANLRLSFGKNGIFTTVLNRLLGERKKLIEKKLEEEAAILAPKKVSKIAGAPLSDELEAQIGAYQVFLANLQEVQTLLTSTFFQPLENAFMNLFETGKFGFKAFADAVLKQIQQLVSKIIATGIISLIANLMSGGLAGAAGGIGGVLARVGGDILKAIGIGGVANPSFGGVGAGAMGMSGQVNIVLRGSDLVGALNRTNATINRVG
jgi:hypothetical protein